MIGGMTAMGGGNGTTQDIHAEATLANGARAAVDAVVRLGGMPTGGPPYRVLHWRYGDLGQEAPGTRGGSAGGTATAAGGARRAGRGLRKGAG